MDGAILDRCNANRSNIQSYLDLSWYVCMFDKCVNCRVVIVIK